MPLISALQRYVDGNDNSERRQNFDAIRAACMAVGILQRDMPVHVLNEYCHPDRQFYPTPEFNEENLPRSVSFYDYNMRREHALFPLIVSDTSGLGIDFALTRGAAWLCGGADWRPSLGAILCRGAGRITSILRVMGLSGG